MSFIVWASYESGPVQGHEESFVAAAGLPGLSSLSVMTGHPSISDTNMMPGQLQSTLRMSDPCLTPASPFSGVHTSAPTRPRPAETGSHLVLGTWNWTKRPWRRCAPCRDGHILRLVHLSLQPRCEPIRLCLRLQTRCQTLWSVPWQVATSCP